MAMTYECVCPHCIHYGYIPAKLEGPMCDCYPAEEYCSEEMENFNTTEGCYLYEAAD